MSRTHPVVSALAALMLLLQSFAVTATPLAKMSATAVRVLNEEMPCAGSMSGDQKPMPCCDVNHCPDIALCMFGVFVPAQIVATQFHPTAQQPEPPAPSLAPVATPQRLFRPPIALHA